MITESDRQIAETGKADQHKDPDSEFNFDITHGHPLSRTYLKIIRMCIVP